MNVISERLQLFEQILRSNLLVKVIEKISTAFMVRFLTKEHVVKEGQDLVCCGDQGFLLPSSGSQFPILRG
jgi:hypothetical protein